VDPFDLQRFVDAQDGTFAAALAELSSGAKQGHWMWFIFPQLAGLGQSSTAQYYSIASLGEARAFLDHPLLGRRLRRCADAILAWAGRRTAEQMFGSLDALKLRSSLTLFDLAEPRACFADAIAAFFQRPDQRTLALLRQSR
jgi:uncharacterized protein (DUF1810 family)